ncbi:MAG: N-6 DNA methylase [Desulfobacteraceae bacterium]|nr:N-6 DNA methylase [Desulfobacteraceae bacterium]
MDINEFTKLLGYSDSPSYLPKSKFNRYPGYSHIFRKAEKECSLHGVYILGGNDNDTIIPVVYICEAENEEDAANLHKRVWNQNVVPFLLISTPKTFRLYPGFKYNSESEKSDTQTILKISKTANQVLEHLSEFKASAIDIGHIWKKWGKEISGEARVDRRLLNTLKRLGKQLIENGLPRHLAHSLIGKYVYLNYLRDRNILSDRKFEQWEIEPESVFGRNAALKGFFSIVDRLDEWLNGALFPISSRGKNRPRLKHIQMVASAFAGDDLESGQMHLDFKAYDFEYIPTETLSVVYQQFLHDEGRERSQGAYYTPVHLVNFILNELDAKLPLQKGMSVLDPACGSGAFLVQCYRLIIERELGQGTKNRLPPSKLRNILTRHVYGLDVDEDACGVTELGLTLTLLDYVDPPDLEKACYKKFQLPVLRNQNVFHCRKGFFATTSDFEKNKPRKGFDWIVGNPPWKKLSHKSDDAGDKAALKWIANYRERLFPVSDNQLAEAFAGGVTEYVSKQGLIGLLMPAATLFKTKGEIFRKQFFSKTNTWCIVNFSNLRHLLFEGAVSPTAAFFYSFSGDGGEKSSRIISYAPFAVNQSIRSDTNKRGKTKLWTVTVDASEIREISRKDAISGSSLPWKIAMWGSFRDSHLINSLSKEFIPLAEFAKNHDLHIHEGPQLRNQNTKEPVEYVPEVIGKPEIDMKALRGCDKIFSFPSEALKIVGAERAYVRKGRGVKPLIVCRPPHIIVDAARRFAVFSEEFIVVPPRQIGIAGKSSNTNLLKALTLYLNSEFARYQQFMTSTFWGIERDRPDKDNLEKLPIPIDLLSKKELKNWARLHDEIVNEEKKIQRNGTNLPVQKKRESKLNILLTELNKAVYDLLKLSETEKWLVEDLLFVRMEMNEGRIPQEAVRSANLSEIQTYAEILKTELDNFLDNEIKDQHKVSACYSDQIAMLRIEHSEIAPAGPVSVFKVSNSEIEDEFSRLRKNLSHRQGQWIYFERNLKYYEGRTTYFFKPIQRLNWLRSQALLDADEFIAEKLS